MRFQRSSELPATGSPSASTSHTRSRSPSSSGEATGSPSITIRSASLPTLTVPTCSSKPSAATAGSARALGLDGHVGTVTVGKLADLVVIDGDPLASPQLLGDRDRVWLVLQLGEPVAGASLER